MIKLWNEGNEDISVVQASRTRESFFTERWRRSSIASWAVLCGSSNFKLLDRAIVTSPDRR
jgi:hypothetical protein